MSERPRRTPTVPLIIIGLIAAAASAMSLGHVAGWETPQLRDLAPESILLVGAGILVAGVLGLTRERRRQR